MPLTTDRPGDSFTSLLQKGGKWQSWPDWAVSRIRQNKDGKMSLQNLCSTSHLLRGHFLKWLRPGIFTHPKRSSLVTTQGTLQCSPEWAPQPFQWLFQLKFLMNHARPGERSLMTRVTLTSFKETSYMADDCRILTGSLTELCCYSGPMAWPHPSLLCRGPSCTERTQWCSPVCPELVKWTCLLPLSLTPMI